MMRHGLPHAVRRLFRLDAPAVDVDRAVDDELRFHFDMTVRELMANGMASDEARRAAEKRFGDVRMTRERLAGIDRERVGRMRRAERWSALAQDTRYALRGMRRAPGFTAVIVATLALGIGANSTMFGIVDRLLLSAPPGVVDGGSLTRIYFERRSSGMSGPISPITDYATYAALRDSNRTLAGLAAFWTSTNSVSGRGDAAQSVRVVMASGNYFSLLGTRPQRGRFITAVDDSVHAGQPIAVISDAFWRRQYGADENVLGKTIVIDERPLTIAGIAPRGFGGMNGEPLDLWIPLSVGAAAIAGADWPTSNATGWLTSFGRLNAGTDRADAARDLTRVMRIIAPDSTSFNYAVSVQAAPAQIAREPGSTTRRASGSVATWLAGVAAMVLLIACANVANLQLARALRRRREFAVRIALGVGRGRLLAQLMTESLLLAFAGGAAALVVAHWGGAVVRRMLLPDFLWSESLLNARMLAFTGAATIATGVLTGLAPMVQLKIGRVADALRSGGRDAMATRSSLRASLLVTQAALSVVLLIGAGVFLRSLHRIRTMDYGYEPTKLLLIDAAFTTGTASADRIAAFDRMAERAKSFSGVTHAALAHTAPFWSMLRGTVSIPGADTLPAMRPLVNAVTPGYFAALGTPILSGRAFTAGDRFGAPRVTIVNASMARRAWPGQNPLGKCMKVGGDTMPCSEVVGVVPDMKVNQLGEAPVLQFFVPLEQRQRVAGLRTLIVRTDGLVAGVSEPLRRALSEVAPQVHFVTLRTVQSRIESQARPWRLGATMFGLFGALALLVTAVGLYSGISYIVTQRTHEFGVRAALGARTANLVVLVVARGLVPAVVGLAGGLVVALLLGRFLEPLLFDTSPRDARLVGAVVAALLATSVAACLVPAWRAARVDPAVALRSD